MAADEEQVLGMGTEIEFEGRTYRMAPLTFELQAKYVAWLKRQAVEAIRQQRSYLTEEEYDKKMDRVDRNIAAGVYGFGSDLCIQSVKGPDGLKELVRLTLGKNHPEVDHEFVDRLFETKVKEAAAALQRANADPLPETPTTQSAG